MSPATDPPVLDLVTKTSKLNDGLLSGRSGHFPRPYHSVMALFDRCCSLLGAIRVLLTYDFVHEAVILGRPLFTDSLALTEIAASDENGRKELAVRLYMDGLAHADALFRIAKSRGGNIDGEFAALAEERKGVEGMPAARV